MVPEAKDLGPYRVDHAPDHHPLKRADGRSS